MRQCPVANGSRHGAFIQQGYRTQLPQPRLPLVTVISQ